MSTENGPDRSLHPNLKRTFRNAAPAARRELLHSIGVIDDEGAPIFARHASGLEGWQLPPESVISTSPIPLCLAQNVVIDGEPRHVLMATEERSVVAGLSKAASMAAAHGGIRTKAARTNTVHGQLIYFCHDAPERNERLLQVHDALPDIVDRIRREDEEYGRHGCGLTYPPVCSTWSSAGLGGIVVRIAMSTGEAMGANMVTRMAGRIAESLRSRVPHMPCARICSNHLQGWKVRAEGVWSVDTPEHIVALALLADADTYRAVTHNKGIMNGVTAVALAVGQDTRAIEACVHAQAVTETGLGSLSRFTKETSDTVRGTLELTLPLGAVGGATTAPFARQAMRVMRATTARELAIVMTAAGLLQNFAALRMLVQEGVHEAHQRLHDVR